MISIIVPAYNESKSIKQAIQTITDSIDEFIIENYEIIVVDDGSEDNTAEIALESNATVVRHLHNIGYGYSLKSGIDKAKYDCVCIIDADLTYPADKINEMYQTYQQGYDLVVGARTGDEFTGSFAKSILRKLLKFIAEFVVEREVLDANSGLRIFSKKTIKGYSKFLCNTFSFTTTQTLAYMMTQRFVCYVPIDYYKRSGTSKVNMLKDSFRTFFYILKTVMYYNPFKIFLLFSVICLVLSLAGFLTAALTGINAPYLLGIGGFLVSLIMLGLGLLADLVVKTWGGK